MNRADTLGAFDNVFKAIFNCGIVPVITVEDVAAALPLAQALGFAGVDVLEVTFRTAAAEEAIKRLSGTGSLVGAGTVLTVETAKKAIEAGASFIMSPGFNPKVVEYCLENGVCVIPGVSRATDIEEALSYNLNVLKFFPAEVNGGVKALNSLKEPYGNVRFIPTGGIGPKNLASYLALDCVIACGGSWMVPKDLINTRNFAEISRITREALSIVHGFKFAHMAMNFIDESAAGAAADAFSDIFGFGKRDIGVSIFSTDFIELMKSPNPEEFGHIGIKCVNLRRAMAYLEAKGAAFDMETLKIRNGKPVFVYLKEPIGSFRVHLVSL